MESSEDQKNEEQDLEESKELSNTDTDKMDIDEPQNQLMIKHLRKLRRKSIKIKIKKCPMRAREESAGVEEQPKHWNLLLNHWMKKVAENENEVGVPSDESKQDEVALEEKQTDEEAEKPIESIEENDEKNKEVIIEEDKEEEILKTKESEQEQEDKDEERKSEELNKMNLMKKWKKLERPKKKLTKKKMLINHLHLKKNLHL